jgi:hypothetical protein
MKKLIIGALFAAVAFTGGTETKQASAQGYGMAGCGLGSIVLGNKPGIMQIFAATTNGTFGSQTFGITSGTSNCSDTAGGAPSAAAFIETNREALAKDISRGNGETIKNLATLSGCGDSMAVGATLQRSFKTIFPSAEISNTQVSSNVIQVLRSEKSLACNRLI